MCQSAQKNRIHSPFFPRCFGTTTDPRSVDVWAHRLLPSTVVAFSGAIARNLKEFQSTAGEDQEMRASRVQHHSESDTDSNRFGQRWQSSSAGIFEQGDEVEVIDAISALVAFIPRAIQYSDAFCQP